MPNYGKLNYPTVVPHNIFVLWVDFCWDRAFHSKFRGTNNILLNTGVGLFAKFIYKPESVSMIITNG